jgi:hypothetical protein|tara:strand:+ start:2256 stop:2732 length:477 start_codon:yes stop_codon:yes gene_type:complete
MAIIEGTAYWASLTRPNSKFEPMWRVDLSVSDEVAEDFKSKGISVGQTVVDEQTINNIVRFKRKVSKANGDKNQPPTLVDASKQPLDKIVGNGSKVKVMYRSYDWNFKGKKGVGLDLQAVQVSDLIEYLPRDEFEIEEKVSIKNADGSSASVDIKEDF